MRREWDLEDLIECWTLDESEFELVGNKSGATRLGFSLMLKFFGSDRSTPETGNSRTYGPPGWLAGVSGIS
jgi:hypothetical protein